MDNISILCSNMFLVSPLTPSASSPASRDRLWALESQSVAAVWRPARFPKLSTSVWLCRGVQPSSVLRRQQLLLVCGPKRAGSTRNPLTRCCETCLWVSLAVKPSFLMKKHWLNGLIFGHFILFPYFIFKFTFRIKANKIICFSQLKLSATF